MIEGFPKRIHCLGAGGAGMLPLALYLADAGHEVSAEDSALSPEAADLFSARRIRVGEFVPDGEVGIIFSSAISTQHPARVFAESSGSFCVRRGECLAVIAKSKRLVAITGSHGKTTTCAILVDILDALEVDFGYLLGALFDRDAPCRYSDGDWLVAEIDESDGTIEGFSPEISIVLNVDHDHHARYASEDDYFSVFERLVTRTRSEVILDTRLRDRLEAFASGPLVTLGEGGGIELDTKAIGSGWTELNLKGSSQGAGILINRSGEMNAIDAGFAFLAAEAMGYCAKLGQVFELRSVKRRQRCWYNSPEIQILEDYAHHPREIEAVLKSLDARKGWSTVVVFQAHRYTRTQRLKAEFAKSLSICEELILLEVYAASEEAVDGGRVEDLFEACSGELKSVRFIRERDHPVAQLEERAKSGPVRILFLGAGEGDKLARRLRDRLAGQDIRWGNVYKSLAAVSSFGTTILAHEPLAAKTTMRVGGVAERYFEPESLPQLLSVLKSCDAAGLPVRPIGRGSNLVVADEGVSGLVIRLGHPYWSRFTLREEGRAQVGAGMRIKALCGQAAKAGLEGFEFLEGIPGNLGGVLRMNAGAMGGWIFDVVESIRYVTLAGELLEATKSDLEFGYRYCRELESAIVIDAVLVSKKAGGSIADIRRTIDTYQNKRKESQPREPSAGCIFKNPEGDSAGRLIDELGLKGSAIGGAEISMVHGNFIINRGGARSSDVVELVKFARRVAWERKGVDLHPEVLLFGSTWEDALK